MDRDKLSTAEIDDLYVSGQLPEEEWLRLRLYRNQASERSFKERGEKKWKRVLSLGLILLGLFTLRPGTINASSIERQSGPSRDSVSPYKDVNNIGIDIDIDIEEIVKNWLKEKFNLQEGEFDLYILGNNFFGIKLHEIKAGDQIENSQGKFNSISPDKPQVYGFIKEGEQKVVLFPNVLTPYGRFYVEGVDIEKGEVVYRSESGIEISVGINNMSEESIAEVLVNSINTQISEGQLVVVRSDASQELPDFYQIESPIPTGGSETSVFLFFNSIQNNLILSFGDGKSVVINLPDDLADKFKTTATNTEFVVDESGNLVGKGLPEGVSLRLQEGYPVLSYQKTTVLGRVQEGGLNVRSGPGTNFSKVGSLSGGTEIQVFHGSTLIVPGEGEYMLGLRDRRDESGKLTYEIVLQKTDAQGEIIEEKSLSEASAIPDLWAKIVYNGGEGYVAVRYNGSELVKLGATGVEEKIEIAPSADLLLPPDFENATELKVALNDFVNAMEMVGIKVDVEEVKKNLIFRKIRGNDGKEYVVGVYRVTGLDGTPYVFPLKAERYENGELRWDFKSASRVLAEAQGVLLGNNDEAWRSDLGEKLEYFGTIAMAEGFAGTEGYRIRFNESDLPYIEEAYERVRTIINRGGYPFFKTSIVPSFLNGVPPDLDKAIKSMSVEDVERLLRGHVERVMTYQPNKNAPKFKDLVDVWEIVGEVNPYYIQRGWNRHPFIEKFAKPNDPDFGWKKFFEIVFRTAQQIDPDALLIVSNYNNEYPNDLHPGGTQKQTLEIIRYLKSIGINNVGVGLHMHLNLYGDHVIPTPPQFANVIRLYRSSGAEPIITEFDLNISTKPHVPAGRPDWWPSVAFNPNTRYADQARIYYDLVKTYLEETRGQENRIISWWGRRDNHSWIELGHKVEDADPLLFDHNGKPKPAFFAVSSALYESLLEKFD